MSLILDALKKADQERKEDEQQGPPSIDTRYLHSPQFDGARQRRLYIALAISIVLLLALLLFWSMFISDKQAPSLGDTLDTPVNTPTSEAPNTQAARQNTSKPSFASAPDLEPTETRATTKETLPTLEKDVKFTQNQAPNTRRTIAPKNAANQSQNTAQDQSKIAALYSQKNTETQQSAKQASENKEGSSKDLNRDINPKANANSEKTHAVSTQAQIQAQAQIKTASAKPPVTQAPKQPNVEHARASARNPQLNDYPQVKLIKELPFSLQSDIPTLMYSGHQYSNRGNNFIILNGKTLSENARGSGGIKVEKILEDGAILSINNQQFKMIALNSWLNY